MRLRKAVLPGARPGARPVARRCWGPDASRDASTCRSSRRCPASRWSRSPNRADARDACLNLAPGTTSFHADFAELLDAHPLDAVVICLPPALHSRAAVAGFARGLHVYVEKPLAISAGDGRGMLDAWRRAGTVGMVGFNHRFHPLALAL
jgi:predicted dehydrogenase